MAKDIEIDPPVKKGNESWKPASVAQLSNLPEGYRWRWCDKDPGNIAKKRAEHWVYAQEIPGVTAAKVMPSLPIVDGTGVTGAIEHRERVLMALPEHWGQARDEYFQELTTRQTVGLKEQAEAENQRLGARAGIKAPPLRGEIVIR